MCVYRWVNYSGYLCRTALCPSGNFSSEIFFFTKILNYLIIPEQAPVRPYSNHQNCDAFQGTGFSLRPQSQGIPLLALLSRASTSFLGISCVLALDAVQHLHHTRFGGSETTCHPIGYSGWERSPSFSFKAKENSVFCLSSKGFVQTLSRQFD